MGHLKKFIALLHNDDPSLTKLDIGFNAISDVRFSELMDSLKRNTYLTHLRMPGITIPRHLAERMAKMLETNSTLQYLNIANIHTFRESYIVIIRSLSKNKSLKELRISYSAGFY